MGNILKNKNLRPLLVILSLIIFGLNFTPVFAQIMEVELLGGGYHIKGPSIIMFPKVTASFVDQTTTPINIRNLEQDNFIEIADENGGNNFQVTISATDFTYTDASTGVTYSFPNTNLAIKSTDNYQGTLDITTVQGLSSAVSLVAPAKDNFVTLDTTQILLIGTGQAPGKWRIYPLLQATVPGGTHPTRQGEFYHSTITLTII